MIWVYGCMGVCLTVVRKEKCAHTRKMMFLVWAQWGALGHDFTNVYQQIFAWYHEFVRRRRTFWRINPCRLFLIFKFSTLVTFAFLSASVFHPLPTFAPPF